MRALFLNHTFPGPFLYLAAGFGALPGSITLFASEYGRRDMVVPGVRRVILPRPKERRVPPAHSAVPLFDKAERDMGMAFRRARSTATSLLKLRQEGFVPDIVFSSATMGNALYVRSVFPEAFTVVYGDWYDAGGRGDLVEPGGLDLPGAPRAVKNFLQNMALLDCELCFTATEWQRRQYPYTLAASMFVLPQCVDADFFSPAPGVRFSWPDGAPDAGREIVAVSGRGMERTDGMQSFLCHIPDLLRERPACHVALMAGNARAEVLAAWDGMSGSTTAWRDRVHILGFLPSETYRSLLRAARLYVYLNAPDMLSTGLLEAMSSACLIVAADTGAVREIIREGETGFLYAAGRYAELGKKMAELLECADELAPVGEAARKTILARHCVRVTLKSELNFFLKYHRLWHKMGAFPSASARVPPTRPR